MTLQAKSYEDKQSWVKAVNEKMMDKQAAAASFQAAAGGGQVGFGWASGAGGDDDDGEGKSGVGYTRVKKDKKGEAHISAF